MSSTRAQQAHAALALAEERRRARLAAAARDHEERTRRSLLIAGHEVGTIKPTAETEAKLRPDPIVRLVANETLSREQGRAALEIRVIYERVAAGLLARTGDPANRSPGTVPNMPERIALLHTQRCTIAFQELRRKSSALPLSLPLGRTCASRIARMQVPSTIFGWCDR